MVAGPWGYGGGDHAAMVTVVAVITLVIDFPDVTAVHSTIRTNTFEILGT